MQVPKEELEEACCLCDMYFLGWAGLGKERHANKEAAGGHQPEEEPGQLGPGTDSSQGSRAPQGGDV